MINCIEYKGYIGTVEYCDEDNIFHGKVMDIPKSLILYHGDNLESLKKDFHEAVDFYLSCCDEKNESPVDSNYCGNLADIQIPPTIHMMLYSYSETHNKTPSQTVEEALTKYMMA